MWTQTDCRVDQKQPIDHKSGLWRNRLFIPTSFSSRNREFFLFCLFLKRSYRKGTVVMLTYWNIKIWLNLNYLLFKCTAFRTDGLPVSDLGLKLVVWCCHLGLKAKDGSVRSYELHKWKDSKAYSAKSNRRTPLSLQCHCRNHWGHVWNRLVSAPAPSSLHIMVSLGWAACLLKHKSNYDWNPVCIFPSHGPEWCGSFSGA